MPTILMRFQSKGCYTQLGNPINRIGSGVKRQAPSSGQWQTEE